ncbi:MAG: peptidoglycan bridge formation glycyltransferase FemA/FemB family protein [archaeon]|nr:peptidoglycan bridge formation glycyltransferase FemA/FemB family protein [archaeon]
MVWKGFKDIQATIIIDLSKTEEELKNNISRDAKRGIKKAEEAGLTVKTGKEHWDEFYEIYKDTITRGGITPKKSEELKKEVDELFSCFKDNKLIAGIGLKFEEDKTNLFLNASLHEYQSLYPNNLLYWTTLIYSKKNGFKFFDLGGYQLSTKEGEKLNEVNKFKERWGGEVKEYYIYSKNPVYILGRKVIRNVHPVKKIRDKIKLTKYQIKEKKDKKLSVKRLFKKLVYDKRKMLIFSIDLKNVPKIEPKTNVILKKTDLNYIKSIEDYPLPERFRNTIDGENEFFIFLKDDKIVHSSRIRYDRMDISEVNLNIPLNEKEACIFDCFTEENSRGLGLYPAMLLNILQYLKEKGFETCYIYCDAKNENSIRGIKKAGFGEYKKIDYMNVLGIKKKKEEDIMMQNEKNE